jgi:acyl dehydratase
MKIPSTFVGTTLKDYHTKVEWRNSMNYAAAVEDNNPWYFDDERDGGIIAPPMFCIALTWPILQNIWDNIEADDFPMEIIPTLVHYTEHLELHRPIKPGDALVIKGKIVAIVPHRAGTHIVIRFDAQDKKGIPAFTEHIGAMMRGVRCTDAGQGEENLPKVPALTEEQQPGWSSLIHIDALRPFVYDGCADITFPIHTSKQFAHQVGLPDIILQGTATLAFAIREIIDREADSNPLRLQSLSCRFSGMVLPGTDITVELLGKSVKQHSTDLFFHVLNQDGQKAISGGFAFLTTE